MISLKNKGKKIVYWGIGSICKQCLERYPEVEPFFFIDSNSEQRIFKGKTVKSPKEIKNWSQYFVVIVIKSEKARNEIQEYLEAKGLCQESSFCTYEEAFLCKRPTIEESINLVKEYMSEHNYVVNPILLHVPIEDSRKSKNMVHFLSSYIEKRGTEKCIIFSRLQVMSSEMASEKLKCKVFHLPDIVNNDQRDDIDLENAKRIRNKLSEKEVNWIKEMEQRKISFDRNKAFYKSIESYYYYKSIIKLTKPCKIIIWGNWYRDTYILGHLAEKYGIPHGYMEYGWIPGTYQVDPGGIAGQSEYAVFSRLFEQIKMENVYDIKKIKRYIREQKLDTWDFANTEEDNTALLNINKNRKTLFLVGMDDHGMRMNPENDYWKKYISSIVGSTEEALFLLIQLCRKNSWNLIFKPHPGNSVPDLGKYKNNVILVRSIEVDRLIEMADVVVSISSSVEYKSLIYGKPLVQLGITTLLGKDCTYIVSDIKTLEEQLSLALKNGMTDHQTENFDRLLQILLQRYLWDDMSVRSLRYGLTVEQDFLEGEISAR